METNKEIETILGNEVIQADLLRDQVRRLEQTIEHRDETIASLRNKQSIYENQTIDSMIADMVDKATQDTPDKSYIDDTIYDQVEDKIEELEYDMKQEIKEMKDEVKEKLKEFKIDKEDLIDEVIQAIVSRLL